MNQLVNKKFKCSVSSVLNRDIRQHGKTFLFDGCEDTAWSSDQGSPQHISVLFDAPTTITAFGIQFQGGFVGKDCTVVLEDSVGNSLQTEPFYPDDINAKQTFHLSKPIQNAVKLRTNFKGSTDFFGRIIIYNFEVY